MARRWQVLLAAGLLGALAACSGVGSEVDTGAADEEPAAEVQQVEPAPREGTRSALDDRYDESFPEPLIDPFAIRLGGPPPDGIPPIDDPAFEKVAAVDWLEADEPVLSLTVGDETRAYPLRVMTWHEIVNDTVDGVPVAVTYCPLCNSGVAFERTADGKVLDFGTSGMLYADNLVMYDRQTESLWPQLTGQASVGVMTGTQLKAIPMGVVGWDDFREANPKSLVLSQKTGFDRPYGRNPYVGYDDPNGGLLFGLPERLDRRLPVKERVVGISGDEQSVAVVRRSLVGTPTAVQLDGRDLVVWHTPGQRSALDSSDLGEGAEIGSVAVFDASVDGRTLTFAQDGDAFRDEETGSTWNILGRATAGPLKGTQLDPYRHLDTFWFAWQAFNPDSELIARAS